MAAFSLIRIMWLSFLSPADGQPGLPLMVIGPVRPRPELQRFSLLLPDRSSPSPG
jgi:hypothetical protein